MDELDRAEFRRMRLEAFDASLPPRFRDVSFDTYEPATPKLRAALELVRIWSDEPRDIGLFITGPVGCGKTHLALSAARALVSNGAQVRFTTATDLIDRAKRSIDGDGNKPHPSVIAKNCDCLVLDDLGTERATDYTRELLFNLIDAIYLASKLIIVTSNLDYAELGHEKSLGERATSRLAHMTDKVQVVGEDWRKREHKGRKA